MRTRARPKQSLGIVPRCLKHCILWDQRHYLFKEAKKNVRRVMRKEREKRKKKKNKRKQVASNMILEKERADRVSIYRVIYMCVDGVSAVMSIDRVEIASAIGIVQLMQLFCSGVAQNFAHRYIYIYRHTHTHFRYARDHSRCPSLFFLQRIFD